MPQSQFTADTVKRIVQDEFKRYHSTRPRIIRGEMATQTETDFPDDVSERSFGMTSAIEEMRRVGGDPGIARGEQIGLEAKIEQEELKEREEEQRERSRRAAASMFKRLPGMQQQPGFGESALLPPTSLGSPQRSVRLVSREEQEAEAEEQRQALGLPPAQIQGFTLSQLRDMPEERRMEILGME